ncbi:arylsulfatase [Mediterraneibacter sp. NSJ-55]|uniref:Arylsulfatase n=1 Tax=Mediterraneibacter hominis TaxID=2763054 RepID=A0A923LGP9_9FIRM|nr:arylsulfatase [Mediterraneibacter hominis]MBC5687980.1 arylsulfatase [Mediterraneibacter hominis]
MKQPNILFIMTDQLRWDCLGYAGHPDVKTPYLDTLASRGVVFERAYSACPSCIAARAALHTGMEQAHHGRVGYEDNIPWKYAHTLAGELSAAGYYTQCVGKMHVHPLRNYLGFHNVELHDGYLHSARYSDIPYQESQFVADDYFYWLKQELGTAADVTETGLDCNSYLSRPWIREERFHPTNWVTDRSIDFLRRRDPGRPFFLMASYLRPHPPFDAPSHYFDMYRSMTLRPPFVGDWESTEELKRYGRIFDSRTGPADPELIRQAQIGYYACITHLDHQIGRLIMALIEHKLYDNTVILFTSDHGEELCDHHMFRKSRPYEGSCHIPLFLCAGKEALETFCPSSSCRGLIELRDIMPTLLEIAGADIPDSVDGTSFLPLVYNPQGTPRTWLHGEHSYAEHSNHWIVTQTDKYIWYTQTGKEQYFRLDEDPHELCDEIHNPVYQERICLLRNHLIDCLKNRPEGFVEKGRLSAGKSYPPTLSNA